MFIGCIILKHYGQCNRMLSFLENTSNKDGYTKDILIRIMEVNGMDTIALILSIIGSLNWGLVSLFKFDLVAWIFGGQTAVLSRIIYGLVGLAGLWCITLLFRKNRPCVDGE